MTTYLARSRDGIVIHRASCRHARIPWAWAEGRGAPEIAATIVVFGYRLCQVCKPVLSQGVTYR